MPVDVRPILELRKEELRRRVESMPPEVNAWAARTRAEIDMNLHFSQLQAISVLVETFHERQLTLLAALDPSASSDDFAVSCRDVVRSIIAGQRVWNYFRSKLDLRLIPQFAAALKTTDIVAYDCYAPVIDRARISGIIAAAAVREPPLTYLSAELSPLTWVRGKRPNDGRNYPLGQATLPIPVIELPLDHLKNSWELLSIHHEVGHDIEADLNLRPALAGSLAQALSAAAMPIERQENWTRWLGEIVADLIALQLGGPAYAAMLLNLLLMPFIQVIIISPEDPHPTHYIRIRLMAASIRAMARSAGAGIVAQELDAQASSLDESWIALYGEPAELLPYGDDFDAVIRAVMDTPFAELNGSSLRAFIPYTAGDHASIKAGKDYLLTGNNRPAGISARHVISAARLAVSENGPAAALDDIDRRTNELVALRAPEGLKAAYPHARVAAVKQFVETFDLDTSLVPE
jgi:hypothetical protein